MLEPEVATLRDILLNDPNVTNSETQATLWAARIIGQMHRAGYMIKRIDPKWSEEWI